MRKHDVSESTKRSYYELMCNMLGFEIILELDLHLMVQASVLPWSVRHFTGQVQDAESQFVRLIK